MVREQLFKAVKLVWTKAQEALMCRALVRERKRKKPERVGRRRDGDSCTRETEPTLLVRT